MKKIKLSTKILSYLIDLIIVFTGVFSAFLLSDYQNNKAAKTRQEQLYIAIYEDLDRFQSSGTSEKGFIHFFEEFEKGMDSAVNKKSLQPIARLHGDYWKIEIIRSMIASDVINDIDIKLFKRISRFNTVHQNFLDMIEDFNRFYENQVTTYYTRDLDQFYEENSNELKPKYQPILLYPKRMVEFSKLLVGLAEELKLEIQDNYLPDDYEK